MGSKNQPGDFDCYANALPNEPMFILLARDKTAAVLVDDWAAERRCRIAAGECPQSDMAMVKEAMQCAENMRTWRNANDGKWRLPQSSPPTAPKVAITDEMVTGAHIWKTLAIGAGAHLEALERHCAVKSGKIGAAHAREGVELREAGRRHIALIRAALATPPAREANVATTAGTCRFIQSDPKAAAVETEAPPPHQRREG